eukprot:scaffold543_cov106-Skeletonema_marinoi.AAC.9
MGEIPIPTLIKAEMKAVVLRTKTFIFTMQQQPPPHMGRIPIPTLIKADMEAAGPTHKNIHFHDEAATYHITFAIIACRKRAECCHRRGMLKLHVCPTIKPCQPSIIQLECSYYAEGRAEQSQTAYNAGTIANTSDDIDYSIRRSMNRL